jgi:hypothetical protein
MKTAMVDPVSSGTLAGLQAATGQASALISSWYSGAAAVAPRITLAGLSAGASPTPRINPIPPPRDTVTVPVHIVLKTDERVLAEIVTKQQVRMGAGAAQGAPYFDSTHGTSPTDFPMA